MTRRERRPVTCSAFRMTSMTSKVPLCTRRLTSFDRDYYSKDKVANGSRAASEKFSNEGEILRYRATAERN